MISEFEQRLADVLGARLPAPFGGRVDLPPGPSAGNFPRLLLGVVHAEPLDPDLGSRRPEVVPGANDPRRVARLRCTVQIDIHAAQNSGRAQALQGLDACLYLMQSPDLLDGSSLAGGAPDPGFLIQGMHTIEAAAPFSPGEDDAGEVRLCLHADGWFWPAGVAGQAGIQIGEIRVRGVSLPIEMSAPPALVAGGDPVELVTTIGATGLRLGGEEGAVPLGLGRLAFALYGPGGKPGKGTLSGGDGGAGGVRLVEVVEGQAVITYTPPDEPTADVLVAALDDGEDGAGIELGRLLLTVRGA